MLNNSASLRIYAGRILPVFDTPGNSLLKRHHQHETVLQHAVKEVVRETESQSLSVVIPLGIALAEKTESRGGVPG